MVASKGEAKIKNKKETKRKIETCVLAWEEGVAKMVYTLMMSHVEIPN